MAQQHLDDADVDPALEHVRGEAVAERVRPERFVKAACLSCLDKGSTGGGLGQRGQQAPTGEEPPCAPVGLPDHAEHLHDRFGEGENTLLVALPDDIKDHPLRIHRRDGQSDRLRDPQAVGVDERETAPIEGLFQRGDQAATIVVGADVG